MGTTGFGLEKAMPKRNTSFDKGESNSWAEMGPMHQNRRLQHEESVEDPGESP